MKEIRRRLPLFAFYDRSGIETYLERQAKKGWLLEKMSAFGWKFRRIEPKQIRFAVTYFPKASPFDPEPSEQQRMFQAFCAHTGWLLVGENAQMQVFYNEAEKPVPIETDAAIEVENIHKSSRKSFLPVYILDILLALMQIGLFFSQFVQRPLNTLASTPWLVAVFCWLLVLLTSMTEVAAYCRWYRKAKAAAELDGSFVETGSRRSLQLLVLLFSIAALIFMLRTFSSARMTLIALISIAMVLGVTAVVVGLTELMKRLKVSAAKNRIITIVMAVVLAFGAAGIGLVMIVGRLSEAIPERVPVATYEDNGWTYKIYRDDLPLIVEDMVDVDYDYYSYEWWQREESPLIGVYEARQNRRLDGTDVPDLSYTIFDIKVPALYEWSKAQLLEELNRYYSFDGETVARGKAVDAAPWGAQEVWQVYYRNREPLGRYLLCYEDRLVAFRSDWNMTPEQMAAAGARLKNARLN